MFLLAWFPILNIYKSPIPLGYGSVLVLLLWVVSLFSNKSLIASVRLPRRYMLFWGWCAVAYIISYLPQIKLSAFIPGGLNLFIFSITLGFLVRFFDVDSFRRQTHVVVMVAGIILILQEIMYFTTGARFTALLPFGELMDGSSMSDLIAYQSSYDRSSSLFREPAHFAQYLLPLLCLELFCEKNQERFLTPYSVFIIIILVLLRSGNGFLGLVVLLLVKGWTYLKNVRIGTKIIAVVVFAPLLAWGVYLYISTEVGASMLERTSELENDDSAASYIRVYRGYALYSELPFRNQIVGINDDDLLRIIPRTSISYLFRGDDVYDLYMNGVQMVLIHDGLIGLIICLWLYISIGKRCRMSGKMQLWLLLVISLLGQTYLSNPMLYATVLCLSENYNDKRQRYENSLLHKARV